MNRVLVILIALLVTVVTIASPIIVIISVNVLFGTQIEITFLTWLAMFFLLGVLRLIFQPRSSKS
jgi:hypothetical protein